MSSGQQLPFENREASSDGARYTARPRVLLVVLADDVLLRTGAAVGTKVDLTVGVETTMSVLTICPM